MSKRRSNYETSKWYKFLSWVNGTVDYDKDSNETESVETERLDTKKQQKETDKVAAEVAATKEKLDVTTYLPKARELYLSDNNLEKSDLDAFEKKSVKLFDRVYKILAVVICMSIIGVLLYTVSFLPKFGDASNPDNNEVSQRYIEQGLQETGAVNIVTGMILDYRAFDTFGESNVLYIACCTVLILLRMDKKSKKESEEDDDKYESEGDMITKKIATMVVPPIIIFGIYVILNGHLSPGGGFSGGAIIGAGLILYQNAFGFKKIKKFFTQKTFKGVTFVALSFYALSKSYSFFTGANHLHSGIPLGISGRILSSGLILPLNICVGLVVACTMYGFYAIFKKGGI